MSQDIPQFPQNLSEADRRRALKLLQAREEIQKDSVLKGRKYSLIQEAFLLSRAKVRVYCGANQSGKSTVGADDLAIKAGQGMPDSLADRYPMDLIHVGEYWASALTFPLANDVVERKLKQAIPKRNIVKHNKELSAFFLQNESEIRIKSEQQGEDNYQSATLYGVWDDEEHKKKIWDEEYVRVMAMGGWLSMTFSPLKGLSWAYEHLWKKAHLYTQTENIHGIKEDVGIVHTLEEIKLLRDRRLKVIPNTAASADPNIECFQMTSYDNPFLPDIEIQNTERMYMDDPAAYNARVLGRFAAGSFNCRFNQQALVKMQASCPSTFKRGEVRNGIFTVKLNGQLILFKDRKPMGQGFYVLGADTSKGGLSGDPACIQIVDHITCEQVGVWHGHAESNEFGRILLELGKYFNYAYIGPEVNFDPSIAKYLKENKYPIARIFTYTTDDDDMKHNLSGTRSKVQNLGWHTNKKTKPLMISNLAQYISQGQVRLNDIATIQELGTYEYKDDNEVTGAMGGCHDDRVMALAIALEVRDRRAVPKKREEDFTSHADQKDPITGY